MKTFSGFVSPRLAPGASLVAYKTSVDIVSKLVTLAITISAARTLDGADFGVFALAMTTGWILGVASDAGLPLYLATHVARALRTGRETRTLVRDVMYWRAGLAVAAVLGALGIGLGLVPARAVAAFVLIVSHQVAGAMFDTLAHGYRGLGRTDVESSLSLLHRGSLALVSLAVLATRPSLLGLAVALAVPSAAALLVSHLVMRRLTAEPAPEVATTRLDARRFFRQAAPLGLGVLLSAVYFRCDVYFLERWHGVELVGRYNAAFRLVDALRLFPAAVLAVHFPALCAAADLGVARRLAGVLAAASLIAVLAIGPFAREWLTLVYGATYGGAAPALVVLVLCLPLFSLNYVLTTQLAAWDQGRAYVAVAGLALAANLAGNTWLIPEGAMVGAAWSTLLTELVVSAGCLAALTRR